MRQQVLPRPGSSVALLGALLLTLGIAAPAAAHDQLVGSDPADGSALATAPAAVVLTFSAEPLAAVGGAAVAVTGPDGASWSDGEPVVAGTTVTQALRSGMPAGAYAVTWRAPSSDGHVLDGTFAFTVEAEPVATPGAAAGPSAEPTPTTTASTAPTPAATPGDDGDEAPGTGPVPWLVGGIAVLAAAGVALAVVLRRRGGLA